MSEKLEPGHFYLVKSSSGAVSYCLYIDFKGKVLGFEYCSEDEGYEFDADANFRISEDLAMRAQEIPAPQIVWVNSRMNSFSDRVTGVVYSLTLFTGDVPNKFWDRIYSLADVQWRLQHKHYEITLQGIGTFQMTSKGASCFSSNLSEGLNVLCRDFFQPEELLPEFGITSEGVERFLKEGWFRSWKELTANPGYYECNGTIIPIPSDPKSYLNDMLLPCFRFDDESGCYVYDKITFLSPCNLLEYRKEMYVGIQVTLNGISGLPRGADPATASPGTRCSGHWMICWRSSMTSWVRTPNWIYLVCRLHLLPWMEGSICSHLIKRFGMIPLGLETRSWHRSEF